MSRVFFQLGGVTLQQWYLLSAEILVARILIWQRKVQGQTELLKSDYVSGDLFILLTLALPEVAK